MGTLVTSVFNQKRNRGTPACEELSSVGLDSDSDLLLPLGNRFLWASVSPSTQSESLFCPSSSDTLRPWGALGEAGRETEFSG